MTVAELIDSLARLPPYALVCMNNAPSRPVVVAETQKVRGETFVVLRSGPTGSDK